MDEIGFHRALWRPGRALDIGAHDGLLTVPLAALPGATVEAFEPLPVALPRLRAATEGLPNVRIHPIALGDQDGTARLEVPSVAGVAQEQWASLVKDYARIQAADPRLDAIVTHDVPLRRLDGFHFTDVTAIKLDVEGAEEEVLRGATETLRKNRPVLTVEIEERHRTDSTRIVPALLASLGYAGFYELNAAWHPAETFQKSLQVASPSPASFEASDPYIFIFYFLPIERAGELPSRK